MLKVAYYRQHAAECRRLAAKSTLPDIRDQLLQMAETWESLATDRERALTRKSEQHHEI